MNKPKIYISGPMSGKVDLNRHAFESVQQALELLGFETINPHCNGLPQSASYNEHLVKDIELLLTCDSIYLIPGWTDSDGAQIECFVADNRGLRVFSYHTPVEMLHEFVISCTRRNQLDNSN